MVQSSLTQIYNTSDVCSLASLSDNLLVWSQDSGQQSHPPHNSLSPMLSLSHSLSCSLTPILYHVLSHVVSCSLYLHLTDGSPCHTHTQVGRKPQQCKHAQMRTIFMVRCLKAVPAVTVCYFKPPSLQFVCCTARNRLSHVCVALTTVAKHSSSVTR